MDKLPKTIVIPGEAYAFCLRCLIHELWSDDCSRLLRLPLMEPNTDDWRELWTAWRRLLRKAPCKRRAALALWPQAQHTFALRLLAARIDGVPLSSNVRASPRKIFAWLSRPLTETRGPKWSVEIVRRLLTMEGYCGWLGGEGDADLGRYLSIWYERKLSGRVEP